MGKDLCCVRTRSRADELACDDIRKKYEFSELSKNSKLPSYLVIHLNLI